MLREGVRRPTRGGQATSSVAAEADGDIGADGSRGPDVDGAADEGDGDPDLLAGGPDPVGRAEGTTDTDVAEIADPGTISAASSGN